MPMMATTAYGADIMQELTSAMAQISRHEAEELTEAIAASRKIFVTGMGRSGLMMKSLAMRLMQMGFQAYVVGETVTPSMEKGDTLIIGSGSGETAGLVSIAEKAKKLGGRIAVMTINRESTIGRIADLTVILPGSPKNAAEGASRSVQPMGTLFEQTLLLFCDAIVLSLMREQGMDGAAMYGRHANLE